MQTHADLELGTYCVTYDTFSETKADLYDDHMAYRSPHTTKKSIVVDNHVMSFKQFEGYDEEHAIFQSRSPEVHDDPNYVSLNFRRLMELRNGVKGFCSGELPKKPWDHFNQTALLHFTRRQWKGPELQKLSPKTGEVNPFLGSPIRVMIVSWKLKCPISDVRFDFETGRLCLKWREVLSSFFTNIKLAGDLHNICQSSTNQQ